MHRKLADYITLSVGLRDLRAGNFVGSHGMHFREGHLPPCPIG